jgi:hypothetical protein
MGLELPFACSRPQHDGNALNFRTFMPIGLPFQSAISQLALAFPDFSSTDQPEEPGALCYTHHNIFPGLFSFVFYYSHSRQRRLGRRRSFAKETPPATTGCRVDDTYARVAWHENPPTPSPRHRDTPANPIPSAHQHYRHPLHGGLKPESPGPETMVGGHWLR